MTRYHALLRVCDMACAHAAATGADHTPDFFATLAVALEDDCPMQSAAAGGTAAKLREAEDARAHFFQLVATSATPPAHQS